MAALGSSLHLPAPLFNASHQNSHPFSFTAKAHPNRQNSKQLHRRRLRVAAATEGSAKSSSKSKEGDDGKGEDASVPSWAQPGSDEPPPWARNEAQKKTSDFEVPFYVYLLASAVTAIAAVGSIFEYANQKPVFGVLSPDSIFYVPLLGFFAFTGIPSSAFLWYKSVQAANKEAEEQDRRDVASIVNYDPPLLFELITPYEQLQNNASRAPCNVIISELLIKCGLWLHDPIVSKNKVSACLLLWRSSWTSADDEDRRDILVRAQWLRAAILGANDGLLSTTSLMLGVGAAKEDRELMIISGIAGAVAGACSMAVGEFVSVSTQRDIEQTTLDMHKSNAEAELSIKNDAETSVKIQESMPVVFSPARSPFMRVVAGDARQDDEAEEMLPNPYKAAGASALAFLCGSLFPIVSALAFSQHKMRIVGIVVVTTVALLGFGGAGARLGGSPVRVSAMRVLLGGWVSMAVTYALLKPLDRDHEKASSK